MPVSHRQLPDLFFRQRVLVFVQVKEQSILNGLMRKMQILVLLVACYMTGTFAKQSVLFSEKILLPIPCKAGEPVTLHL